MLLFQKEIYGETSEGKSQHVQSLISFWSLLYETNYLETGVHGIGLTVCVEKG